jgi:hypothetical protein
MRQLQKYSLYALLFLAVTSLQVKAQSSPIFWIGAHGGVDIGTFSFSPSFSSSDVTIGSKTGMAIGGEFDYWFSDHIGGCYQISYVQKGFKETDNFINEAGNNGSDKVYYTFSYLQVPILFKASFGSAAIKPFVIAGAEIGFRLSLKGEIIQGSLDTTVNVPDSELTKINIGIMLGAGLSYELNSTTLLTITAAYDYGLSNLNPFYGQNGNTQKGYTRDFRISAGVLFGFGKSGE